MVSGKKNVPCHSRSWQLVESPLAGEANFPLCFIQTQLLSPSLPTVPETKWILTGEVALGEPSGKACRTRACGKLAVSIQAEVLPQSYPAPASFPRSESETTKRYRAILIDDIRNPSLKLSGIQLRSVRARTCLREWCALLWKPLLGKASLVH